MLGKIISTVMLMVLFSFTISSYSAHGCDEQAENHHHSTSNNDASHFCCHIHQCLVTIPSSRVVTPELLPQLKAIVEFQETDFQLSFFLSDINRPPITA